MKILIILILLFFIPNAILSQVEILDALKKEGNILVRKRKFTEGIQKFEEIRKLDPKYWKAPYNIGVTYTKMKEWELAIKYFQIAIDIDKRLVAAWHNKGVANMKLFKVNEAISDFETALKLDPNFNESKIPLKKLKEIKKRHEI